MTTVTTSQNDVAKRSEELVKESEMLLDRANALLGYSGAVNVAKAYKAEADEQKKEADIWRLRALVVLGALGASLPLWLSCYSLRAPASTPKTS